MNTTKNKPQPSDPEKKFRLHVDNTVDLMNRCSIRKLKTRIDNQKEIDYRKAMQNSLIMPGQSDLANEQLTYNQYSTVTLQ